MRANTERAAVSTIIGGDCERLHHVRAVTVCCVPVQVSWTCWQRRRRTVLALLRLRQSMYCCSCCSTTNASRPSRRTFP